MSQADETAETKNTDRDGPFEGSFSCSCSRFVNLVGLVLTMTALVRTGSLDPLAVLGAFGVIEAARARERDHSEHLASPIAELETSRRTDVKLATSTVPPASLGRPRRRGARVGVGLALALGRRASAQLRSFSSRSCSYSRVGRRDLRRACTCRDRRPDIDVFQFVVRLEERRARARPCEPRRAVFQSSSLSSRSPP